MVSETSKTPELVREVRKLVKEEEYAKLARKLRRLHPYDISELLQKFNKSLRDKILLNLPNDMLIELIPEFPEEMQSEFVEILSPQMAANLLASISPDDMADVLGDLALDTRKKIVGYFSKEKVREASSLLKHPRDTAGGLMTTEVVSLNKDMLVGKAMEYVRKEAEEYETVYYIYVVDDDGKLVGVLSLRDLFLAPKSKKIKDIMHRNVIKVPEKMDQEEVADIISDYDLLALPVVDRSGKLLGIVTVDDALDVIEDEVTEDLGHLAGVGPKIDSLIDAPVASVVRARIPWLIFALLGGLIAGLVIGVFEETLASVVLLAIFIPVIMSMGGNVGIQSSMVFVRGLATGEIENPWSYFVREVRVGFIMGLIVGGGVALAAQAWKGLPELGLIVGVAMFLTVIIATAMGVIIPNIFNYLGIDPAVSSSPFVTTIQDIIGLVIYFTIASLMLIYLM